MSLWTPPPGDSPRRLADLRVSYDAGVLVEIAGRVAKRDGDLVTIALEVTCGGSKVLGMPKAVVRA